MSENVQKGLIDGLKIDAGELKIAENRRLAVPGV